MKKLLFVLLLCSSALGQFQQKPMLGQQINWTHPLARGLVGCWMNEGSVFDLSGNGNNGTFVGDTHFMPGKFGSALDFDGTGDYVDLTAMAKLSVSLNWSIDIWFKNDDTSVDSMIISQALGANDRLFVGYDTSKTSLQIGIYNGSWVIKSIDYDDNNWHHLEFINQAGTISGYFDLQAISGLETGIYPTDDVLLVLGGRNDHNLDFNGQISHVSVVSQIRSFSEIALLYREPFCFMQPSYDLVLYGAMGAPPSVVPTPYYYRGLAIIPVIPAFYFLRKWKCAA